MAECGLPMMQTPCLGGPSRCTTSLESAQTEAASPTAGAGGRSSAHAFRGPEVFELGSEKRSGGDAVSNQSSTCSILWMGDSAASGRSGSRQPPLPAGALPCGPPSAPRRGPSPSPRCMTPQSPLMRQSARSRSPSVVQASSSAVSGGGMLTSSLANGPPIPVIAYQSVDDRPLSAPTVLRSSGGGDISSYACVANMQLPGQLALQQWQMREEAVARQSLVAELQTMGTTTAVRVDHLEAELAESNRHHQAALDECSQQHQELSRTVSHQRRKQTDAVSQASGLAAEAREACTGLAAKLEAAQMAQTSLTTRLDDAVVQWRVGQEQLMHRMQTIERECREELSKASGCAPSPGLHELSAVANAVAMQEQLAARVEHLEQECQELKAAASSATEAGLRELRHCASERIAELSAVTGRRFDDLQARQQSCEASVRTHQRCATDELKLEKEALRKEVTTLRSEMLEIRSHLTAAKAPSFDVEPQIRTIASEVSNVTERAVVAYVDAVRSELSGTVHAVANSCADEVERLRVMLTSLNDGVVAAPGDIATSRSSSHERELDGGIRRRTTVGELADDEGTTVGELADDEGDSGAYDDSGTGDCDENTAERWAALGWPESAEDMPVHGESLYSPRSAATANSAPPELERCYRSRRDLGLPATDLGARRRPTAPPYAGAHPRRQLPRRPASAGPRSASPRPLRGRRPPTPPSWSSVEHLAL
eukprot:gnl/TRDRNA2_/TRDRNA2_49074_c0_seq1.p1 gnl/TRDRNA2_/TRDRNA2_49074_c0~~gnl/TRDRNA2_/TRDRNA2_49074_c0_seq1.p1  ORF type:complete len:714 (+),score=118.23 gnl/TRDRNA2_/TRDRNA2_49074_c0_seq1:49-2190(+)